MTKVALRAYNHEIESMIEQGQRLDEAVAHCRHILTIFPKHLDTYRLLGKAYLEAKRHDQAVDIFQRVLVAAPEDFVSHVGMSIIADDQAKLDEAIWHMERAFEVQPSNAAIQAELQRLFGRRDGVEPAKIRLTRGALAHMYVQGELYTQAISEIRAVLANDPQRMDMQVLLARAYFRNGQKAEAADVCSTLLGMSPYCLDANRLMAEILPGTQAADAAQEHRRRVLELDPYAEFAKGSMFSTDSVADAAVTLDRLEQTGQGFEAAGIAFGLTTNSQNTKLSAATPSWLAAEAQKESNPPSPIAADEDLPDFLRGSGWREVPLDSAEPVGSADNESEIEAEPGELPEWVRALAPQDDQGGSLSLPGTEVTGTGGGISEPSAREVDSQPAAVAGDETPDWLRDLARGAEPTIGAPTPSLKDMSATSSQDEQTPSAPASAPAPAADDQGLAWLEGLAEKHGARPEELLTSPGTRTEKPPDWIEQLRQAPAAVPEGWAPIKEESTESGNVPSEPRGQTQAPPADASMDWLSGLADPDAFAEMEKPAEDAQAPFSVDAVALTDADAVSDPSLPDWLANKGDEGRAPTPMGAPERMSEPESSVDLPDWLADLDTTAKPQTTPSEAATPAISDWLPPVSDSVQMGAEDALWPPQSSEVPAETPELAMPRQKAAPSERDARIPSTVPAGSREPTPVRTRTTPPVSLDEAPSLGTAKTEMGRGNIAAALDIYSRLIRKGRSLPEIIRELREALYRYPVEVPIWQALGDAYMRANRLQEALDAYTKAEELLR